MEPSPFFANIGSWRDHEPSPRSERGEVLRKAGIPPKLDDTEEIWPNWGTVKRVLRRIVVGWFDDGLLAPRCAP
jgi:hypothetical protein